MTEDINDLCAGCGSPICYGECQAYAEIEEQTFRDEVENGIYLPLVTCEGETLCGRCGEPKVSGTKCIGNDECVYGPDGGPAECCNQFGRYCCSCGYSYAIGQI